MIAHIIKYNLAPARTALLALFFFIPELGSAQAVNQVYIFPDAPVTAHPNSNTHIFSDISQGGTFVSYDTSLINFYASNWVNGANSRLPDESANGISGVGGIFRFSGQFLNAQQIISINSLPYNGFPNIRLDNLLNVTAVTSNLHINNTLDFVNGNLILANVDVTVGRDGLGTISGFSNRNFIVTGTAMTGGSLIRSFTGSVTTPTHYPIGTTLTSYTPASIIYKGIPQNIKLRVANNIICLQ